MGLFLTLHNKLRKFSTKEKFPPRPIKTTSPHPLFKQPEKNEVFIWKGKFLLLMVPLGLSNS